MLRTVNLFIILILLLIPFFCFSQTTLTVSDSKRFRFERINTSGEVIPASDIFITFKGSYSNLTYTIKDSTGTELFHLSYPLSRDEFRSNLTAALNKDETNQTAFSEYSIEQVFVWLYSLNQDQDAPLSGTLNLGTIVQIVGDNRDNCIGRITLLEKYSTQHSQFQSLAYSNRKTIDADAQEIFVLIKTVNANRTLLDSSFIKSLKKQFDVNEYPDLDTRTTADSLNKLTHKIDSLQRFYAKYVESDSTKSRLKADTVNLLQKLDSCISKLKDKVVPYIDSRVKLVKLENEIRAKKIFPIERISLQFERGNLEKIQVWVKNENGFLDIYENTFSIGFTNIENYKSFQRIILFIRQNRRVSCGNHIFLSDVLGNYDNLLDLYTRDYSPADTVINNFNPENGPINLKKARNVNLFESRLYSDLQGIDPNVPNGLIQIEISRRFNVSSTRHKAFRRTDVGYLSYFNIYGALTKIEDKTKTLVLHNNNTIVNNTIVSPSFVTNLDLRQYENASLGLDLNCFLFDYPDWKFTIYLDAGIRYGHIPLIDSTDYVQNGVAIRTNAAIPFPGHTITFSLPKITFEFFSERRVGFSFTSAFNHTIALTNNRYKQIMSYAKSDLNNITTERNARNSYMAEVNLRVETSRDGNGQIFFRNRFFWQKGDANTFFVQSQIGYFYNILFRK